MKRALDLLLAGAALLLLLPVLAGVALLVRLTSRGPALYWSRRVGRDSVCFWMPKFRSMRLDTPEMATHLLTDPGRWLTPIGYWLRRTSVDELPQLWSVVRGDMSLVGPRPALHDQYELIEARRQGGIDRLRPGLTGWAQIHGRDELSIPEKVRHDGWYLAHRSLATDVRVLLATVLPVLRAEGIRRETATGRVGASPAGGPVPGDRSRFAFATRVAALVMLALLLRGTLAWRNQVPCRDGIYYLMQVPAYAPAVESRWQTTPSLERCLTAGRRESADVTVGHRPATELNLFPQLLRAAAWYGLAPAVVGKWVNTVVTSLALIPLCWLVRRFASERVALAAGFLYAANAELIEWSVELVRDGIYWALCLTALALGWVCRQAALPVKLGFVGLIVLLTLTTRVEAVLVLIPFAYWSRGSVRKHASALGGILRGQRDRTGVTRGALVGMMLLACFLLVQSSGWLPSVRWTFIGLMQRLATGDLAAGWTAATFADRGWVLLRELVRSVGPVVGLLFCVGLASGGWPSLRRLALPLTPWAVALLLGILAHLLVTGSTTPRYFMMITLLALPMAGFGLVRALDYLAVCRRNGPRLEGPVARRMVLIACLTLLAAPALGKVVVRDYDSRERRAAVGRWVGERYGPGLVLLCSPGVRPYVEYYSRGVGVASPASENPKFWQAEVQRIAPHLVLLEPRATPAFLRGLAAKQVALPVPVGTGRPLLLPPPTVLRLAREEWWTVETAARPLIDPDWRTPASDGASASARRVQQHAFRATDWEPRLLDDGSLRY